MGKRHYANNTLMGMAGNLKRPKTKFLGRKTKTPSKEKRKKREKGTLKRKRGKKENLKSAQSPIG